MEKKRWKLIASVVLTLAEICIMVIEPFIFKIIIDDVIGNGEYDRLLPLLGLAVGTGVAFMGMRYLINILAEQAAQHAIFNLRSSLFKRLMAQTSDFYRKNKAGDLITRSTGDINVINHFLCWCIPKWAEVVCMMAVVLVVFLTISPLYTLCLFVLTPITGFFAVKLGKNIRAAYTEARNQMAVLNTVVQENISGNRVVKAFVREDFEIDRFTRENDDYRDKNLYANLIWLKYGPIIESITNLLNVVNLVLGGIMVIGGSITLGQLNIFLSLAWALNEPMVLMGMVVNDTQRYMASVEKVRTLYYSHNDIQNPKKPYRPERVRGDIRFENVSVKFGRTQVLSGINMEIGRGQVIGLMGPTGGGKTTLVSLISRFLDVSEGSVKVDGVDVRQFDIETLRAAVGMTMQEVFLFSDTVESNIVYGEPDAPVEAAYQAAGSADADGFIRKMPESYDTIIGERGTGLSGGQKQRISLARALAPDMPILVLDDTTSAVDMETEKYIQQQLKAAHTDKTTIIIAQRVSSLKHADRIYIIDDGKITEQGTHEQLMQLRGYYYDTCMLQQGGEERQVG